MPKNAADVIKNLPSSLSFKRYGFINYGLLLLLIASFVYVLIESPVPGAIIWLCFLICIVASKKNEYYIWVSVIAASGLIAYIVATAFNGADSINWTSVILPVIIGVLFVILPVWLKNKMCPSPVERKELYVNLQGKERLRITYDFKDIG